MEKHGELEDQDKCPHIIKYPYLRCIVCNRDASIAGNEPLFLIPTVIDERKEMVVYCGEHFREILQKIIGNHYVSAKTNFMNLFIHHNIYLDENEDKLSYLKYKIRTK